jgi:threonine dehydratase
VITGDDVLSAQRRIGGRLRRTPLLEVGTGPSRLWLKCEHLQHTGVYKARGAFNRMLAARERGQLDPTVGVVAASGGNAGLANAYAASVLGVPATVFVPENAPAVKVARLGEYGAQVRQVGLQYAEAYQAAMAFCATGGALFCHAYDQPEIAAGAGTIGLEILQDLPEVDTVVLAVGGGGMFAGVAAALAGRARIVAVEPVTAPTLHEALKAGRPVDVSVSGIAADSLGARRLGDIAFEMAVQAQPVSILVTDDAIVAARHQLWEDCRIAAEHGAAAAFAGLASGAYVPQPGERVVVVVSGANTDPATLVRAAS